MSMRKKQYSTLYQVRALEEAKNTLWKHNMLILQERLLDQAGVGP